MVRRQVLDVRVHVPGQHSVADLLDEQILRRRVLNLRSPSVEHVQRAPRRQGRSNGVHIPHDDEMHVSQVRSLGHGAETRFAVRVTAQHHQ